MRMNKTVQYYFAYQFIKYLVKDFTDWEAYDLGLIDRDGKKLRDPENREEEEMMSAFFNLVRKTKRLVAKVPGGRSIMGSILAAGFLLKEELNLDGDHIIEGLIEEVQKSDQFEDLSIDNYLSEDRNESLPPGVYKNLPATNEFYNGEHLFYIKEEVEPATHLSGSGLFRLRNSLQRDILISKDHLQRMR